MKTLDSGFRRNDKKELNRSFYTFPPAAGPGISSGEFQK
jgi:hypothetical protein